MGEEQRTAIDLFCGAGGLSAGLTEAGFTIKYAVDSESKTKPTYDANHEIEMEVADIRETEPPAFPGEESLDLVAGGPPCPTFSLVGRSKLNSLEGQSPETDDRHHLYEDFVRFIEHYEPKAFLMENVSGMMSATNEAGEAVVDVVKGKFEDVGYDVSVQVVDAADFGVPQHRERLFFIGNRIGAENVCMDEWRSHREPANAHEREVTFIEDVEPAADSQQTLGEFGTTESPSKSFPTFDRDANRRPWNTVGEAILDLPPVSPDGTMPPTRADTHTLPPLTEYQKWVRGEEPDGDWTDVGLDNHECRGHNLEHLSLYKLLGEGCGWDVSELPQKVNPHRSDVFPDSIKKQHPQEPASTIVAHLYKDGNMFVHPREARSITVREAARLQSFKDTFTFPVARTHAFKQVGNAVPPLLGQALGTAIAEDILS